MFLDLIAGFIRSLFETNPPTPDTAPPELHLAPQKMVQTWVAKSLKLEPESWRCVGGDTFKRGDFEFEIHVSSCRVYRPDYLDCREVQVAVKEWLRNVEEKKAREQAIRDLDRLARAHEPRPE